MNEADDKRIASLTNYQGEIKRTMRTLELWASGRTTKEVEKDLTRLQIVRYKAGYVGGEFKGNIPVYGAQAGGLITRTGMAMVHAGEFVTPVPQVTQTKQSRPSPNVNINFYDTKISSPLDIEMLAQSISRKIARAG